jgi:hypothetical protein
VSSPSPRYGAGDVLAEERTGQRFLVVTVGIESYFVRRLNPGPGGPGVEPLETAWVFEGCEGATVRIDDSSRSAS